MSRKEIDRSFYKKSLKYKAFHQYFFSFLNPMLLKGNSVAKQHQKYLANG